MTPRIATYVGGPLDGQEVTKAGGGRWPIYRDDTGQPIRAQQGDREFGTVGGAPLRRYYTHQQRFDLTVFRWEHFYVHATAWNAWTERVS